VTARPPQNGDALRVLVVDDEPDLEALIRQRFRRDVRDQKFEFFFAANGEEALAVLDAESEISLVLTDLNMPRMDGLTLLSHLSERDSAVKAVVISAYGDLENIRSAMNRGAFDFLTKPIDFRDLDVTMEKTRREIERMRSDREARDALAALRHELEVASQIQRSMLPQVSIPAVESGQVELAGRMDPAQEIGGDFYDYMALPSGRLAVVIGDVSGKGMPAALFMVLTRTLLRSAAFNGRSPAESCRRVNDILCQDDRNGMFVTVFYGEFDLETGNLEYCNAGHNYPFLVRADGTVSTLPAIGGMVLGVRRGLPFESGSVVLGPGDALVMYTDGATEAMNTSHELFNEDRLQELLRGHAAEPLQDVIESIYSAVTAFSEGARQHDDITMLAIRRSPSS
jgi:sigma-B regulation protein RsbU (phosphoserine phosphatase)